MCGEAKLADLATQSTKLHENDPKACQDINLTFQLSPSIKSTNCRTGISLQQPPPPFYVVERKYMLISGLGFIHFYGCN